MTRSASWKVSQYAFEYAKKYGRKRVSCLHKANVLNYTDGLFLQTFREVAKLYPEIDADDMMSDAAWYTIIRDPGRFDVVVTLNHGQYGDIFSSVAAGLAGSLGLAPGANIGDVAAIFEASHGAAPVIADKGVANPLTLILSGAEMLQHIDCGREADAVRSAVSRITTAKKMLTPDLGGSASTEELARAVSDEVRRILNIW